MTSHATQRPASPSGRRWLMLLVGLTAALLFSAGSASPATAHDATANGCTTPVRIPYWNDRFHPQCDTHDHCYNQKWYGNSLWGKAQCDWRFLNEMRGNCGWNVVCQGVAWQYYTAVRDYGYYAWYNSSWFH